MPNKSPSMTIEKLRVTRKSGGLALRLEETKPGVNVVRGENSSGRTTLLQLFEFGLGADPSDIKFIPEIKQCERLVLQITLNGASYTIERKFFGAGQVEVYQGGIDDFPRPFSTVLAVGREFSDYLLGKLGIPRISFVDEYSGKEKSIAFNDLYDGLYLDQGKGFSEIHARLGGTKRENVFKVLTGIVLPDLYAILLDEAGLKKQRENLLQEYGAVERFLGSVELPTPVQIEERMSEIQAERSDIKSQIEVVRQQLRARPDYATPLRQEVLDLESKAAGKQKELVFARQTLQAYVELENQLVADLDKIARIRTSATQLSPFEFEQCPRCLQDITSDMKRREREGQCSVCGRPLARNSDQADELETYGKQVDSQLSELKELQQQYGASISEVNSELDTLQAQLAAKRRALDEASATFVSPVIQNIESLGYTLAALDDEVERLEGFKKWQARVQQMRDELAGLAQRIGKLQERKRELQEQERERLEALRLFENFFIQFIHDIYQDFVMAQINPKSFLPEINEYDYRAKSATQKNIAILGYYYALLRFSLEADSNIPRFLVIDTLRQDDLADPVYKRILAKFKDLETQYTGGFQLFIVVREPFDFLRDDEVVQLVDGEHLLSL